jgi:hypothetical protein
MTRSQGRDQVGDLKTPALRPLETGLRDASDQADKIQAETSPPASPTSTMEGLASAVSTSNLLRIPPTSCKQILWFSFFFDGTGNNLYADEGMLKHSNVAKLYRVHSETSVINGIYRIYIQGVGTYFPEIGDEGGSALGLGCGSMGQERLDYALGKFDEFLRPHLARAKAPSNSILEINISAFGFSRGAALARAFVNILIEGRCDLRGGRWFLRNGAWPVRIRFMGLFDTVASVGLPMSSNTTSTAGAVASSVRYMIGARLRDYKETRPEVLAFAKNALPGADPAPGIYDGHKGWGSKLEVNKYIEEVRHFVAAHEMRNSFPLDSISTLRGSQILKPGQFYETVYPGVHSDVGGSYAPGEGARADLAQEQIGLIPLMHMYSHAMRQGVPLLPKSAWLRQNKEDFNVDGDLVDTYNRYLEEIGSPGSLGLAINSHMRMYFAWRFRAIKLRLEGDKSEYERIATSNRKFKVHEAALNDEIAALTEQEKKYLVELNSLVQRRVSQASARNRGLAGSTASITDGEIKNAHLKHVMARDNLLKAKARKDSLPNMEDLQTLLKVYDKQLLADVQAIRDVYAKRGFFGAAPESERRGELRPHYKIMMEAYESEFEKKKGLQDEVVIRFFDHYIHDSLAAFAKDATIPSDPRVVYLGGDEKYKYASLGGDDRFEGVAAGIA